MLSNVLILIHGPEADQSTNRLYLNKFIQLKGSLANRDLSFENKLEGMPLIPEIATENSNIKFFIFAVTYPRYALNLKMDQLVKIDDRLAKVLVNLHLDNVKLFDTDIALITAPKDPKNIYELTAKVIFTPSISIGRNISYKGGIFSAGIDGMARP